MCVLCHRLERYAAAIILNMHKDNAAALRLHNAIKEVHGRCTDAVEASCERRGDAVNGKFDI